MDQVVVHEISRLTVHFTVCAFANVIVGTVVFVRGSQTRFDMWSENIAGAKACYRIVCFVINFIGRVAFPIDVIEFFYRPAKNDKAGVSRKTAAHIDDKMFLGLRLFGKRCKGQSQKDC